MVSQIMVSQMTPQVAISEHTNQQSVSSADRDLLQACRAGDEQAWLRLLIKYERLVYSIPLNHGLSHEDAADIAQIVFTAFIQRLDSLRDDSNIGGWLTLVTRRHTWRVLKRRQREAVEVLDDETLRVLLPSRANEIEQWELTEWLHRGLSLIGERCRKLLIALYLEEEESSYTELAQQFGIPRGSIGPTRARCLQRLQQMLTR
jgi:RNA polymerase sigma factor (sigma-70 family)